jgi:hypothetical protein
MPSDCLSCCEVSGYMSSTANLCCIDCSLNSVVFRSRLVKGTAFGNYIYFFSKFIFELKSI